MATRAGACRPDLQMVNLTGFGGLGDGTAARFSNNAYTGDICFGDSGGPIFIAGTTTWRSTRT